MSLKPMDQKEWPSPPGFNIRVTTEGRVMIATTGWHYVNQPLIDNLQHRMTEALHHVEIRRIQVMDSLSRDERVMFELLNPSQQWAFINMRFEELHDEEVAV